VKMARERFAWKDRPILCTPPDGGGAVAHVGGALFGLPEAYWRDYTW